MSKIFLTPITVHIARELDDKSVIERLSVPAVTHPLAPGLAVAMVDFGLFRVTHINTGRKLSSRYERANNAVLAMLRMAYMLDQLGVNLDAIETFDQAREVFASKGSLFVNAHPQADPKPFRELYEAENQGDWLNAYGIDHEFPWEGLSDSPLVEISVMEEALGSNRNNVQ